MKAILYSKSLLYVAVSIMMVNDFLHIPAVKAFLERGDNFDPSPSLFGKSNGNESTPVDNVDSDIVD